jgi:hypothetical protein
MEVPSATDAKKESLLEPKKDLPRVPFKSEYHSGFGNGRTTEWFKCADLANVAVCKQHDSEELTPKRRNCGKRAKNKHRNAMTAAMAHAALDHQQQPHDNLAPMSAEIIANIRKDIVKAFTPLITWGYMHAHKRPKDAKVLAHILCTGSTEYAVLIGHSPLHCKVTVRIPRIGMAEYAVLIGKVNDPKLTTMVKKGAYFSTKTSFQTLMGTNNASAIVGKGGRYGRNAQLGIDPASNLTVKFKPNDNSISATAYVQHVDTFGPGY